MTSSNQVQMPESQMEQARELYRRLIAPEVEAANLERLIAFDIDSKEYEIGDDLIEMAHRLKARKPDARIFGFRVGGGPVDRFGYFTSESVRDSWDTRCPRW